MAPVYHRRTMSRRVIKVTAKSTPIVRTSVIRPILKEVEVAPTHVLAAPAGNPISIASPQQTPLIWRHRDVDIELGNRFPYAVDDTTDGVADFEVRGKVVKCFLGKDPMYNQNLNVKATEEDVRRIKAIVCAAPNSDASRPSFEWPFEANKEAVFKFVNKDNLKEDFADIYDAAKTKDIYNVAERRRHSLEANDVRLGSKVIVEFTIAIWRKKPERAGCSFHLISIGVSESAGHNVSGSFHSPKRQRTGK